MTGGQYTSEVGHIPSQPQECGSGHNNCTNIINNNNSAINKCLCPTVVGSVFCVLLTFINVPDCDCILVHAYNALCMQAYTSLVVSCFWSGTRLSPSLPESKQLDNSTLLHVHDVWLYVGNTEELGLSTKCNIYRLFTPCIDLLVTCTCCVFVLLVCVTIR